MNPARSEDVEITESGRPRTPRPTPDHSSATVCPHCGAEVGMGHYVCWNCSKDIRMQAQTEGEIVEEYRGMQAREEIGMERRNRTFFLGLVGLLVVLAAGNLALQWNPGTSVLFVVLAALPSWWAVKSTRRISRLRRMRQEAASA